MDDVSRILEELREKGITIRLDSTGSTGELEYVIETDPLVGLGLKIDKLQETVDSIAAKLDAEDSA